MKRALIVAAVVGMVLAPTAARANHGKDYAKGTVIQTGQKWDFSATSSFNGNNPQGQIRFTNTTSDPNFVVTAEVTCLGVLNNVAEIVGEVTRAHGPGFTTVTFVVINATDSGKFGTGPDLFNASFGVGPTPATCPAGPGFSPVTDGEIVIHDSL
jgi:hypothetical protein